MLVWHFEAVTQSHEICEGRSQKIVSHATAVALMIILPYLQVIFGASRLPLFSRIILVLSDSDVNTLVRVLLFRDQIAETRQLRDDGVVSEVAGAYQQPVVLPWPRTARILLNISVILLAVQV